MTIFVSFFGRQHLGRGLKALGPWAQGPRPQAQGPTPWAQRTGPMGSRPQGILIDYPTNSGEILGATLKPSWPRLKAPTVSIEANIGLYRNS